MKIYTKTTRIAISALLCLAVIASLAACAEKSGGESTNTPTPTTASGSQTAPATAGTTNAPIADEPKAPFIIRAAAGSSPDLRVADTLGFFADEGIQIEWVGDTAAGISPFQLLEQGILDLTSSHPPAIAEAYLAGVDVKVIAPGAVDNEKLPHVYYLVRNDSEIKEFSDLTGKKVGIASSTAPCMDGFVKYIADGAGVDWHTIDFVVLPEPGQEEQALINGQIDMTTSHGEAAIAAIETGEVRLIADTWDVFASEGTGLSPVVVLQSFVDENPDVVQGLVNALYRARLWARDNTWSEDDPNDWHAAYSTLMTDVHRDRGTTIEGGFRPVWYTAEKNTPIDWLRQWFDIAEIAGTWKHGDIVPEDILCNDFVPEDAPVSDKEISYTSKY
ncbi:MAG: ABC transporter substrate-binding protein [Oscillospiraceae bacterium]|jgi:ABC-type nitrate/sulfonate/bicarbonate transport system substrate-binding protein|nr:ABC transporter substrate-binding protein [Oscillospiraceae bacterium]